MQMTNGSIWDYKHHWKVVPTNGVVTRTGLLVMGAGVALQAKQRFPGIDRDLGYLVHSIGNACYILPKYKVITVPTKHHFKDKASITLIREGVAYLNALPKNPEMSDIVLPLLGAGLGELHPYDVLEELRRLDDRFTLVLR